MLGDLHLIFQRLALLLQRFRLLAFFRNNKFFFVAGRARPLNLQAIGVKALLSPSQVRLHLLERMP